MGTGPALESQHGDTLILAILFKKQSHLYMVSSGGKNKK